MNWAYRPMIPWDNVTISARAPITKANKRLGSLTVGAGRHGMAVSRGLVAQNGRCIRCFASPLTNRASACGMAAQAGTNRPAADKQGTIANSGPAFNTPHMLPVRSTAVLSLAMHPEMLGGSFKTHHLPSSVYAYMAVPPPLRGTALLLIPAPHKQRL